MRVARGPGILLFVKNCTTVCSSILQCLQFNTAVFAVTMSRILVQNVIILYTSHCNKVIIIIQCVNMHVCVCMCVCDTLST